MDETTLSSMYNSRVYDNFLIHWKYVKREKIAGAKKGETQWRYWYKEPDEQKTTIAINTDTLSRVPKTTTPTKQTEKDSPDKSIIEKGLDWLYNKLQDSERVNVRDPELKYQKEKLAKSNPLPSLDIKTTATTLDEDTKAVNPNYNPTDDAYSRNCAYCTAAYDLRRRGYDVVANPYPNDDELYEGTLSERMSWYEDLSLDNIRTMTEVLNDNANGLKPGTTDKIETYDDYLSIMENGFTSYENSKEMKKLAINALKKELETYPNGARGNLSVWWENGGAHSVIWENEKGKVFIRDAQDGKTYDLETYLKYSNSFYYYRTDTLTPDEDILVAVSNKKRRSGGRR